MFCLQFLTMLIKIWIYFFQSPRKHDEPLKCLPSTATFSNKPRGNPSSNPLCWIHIEQHELIPDALIFTASSLISHRELMALMQRISLALLSRPKRIDCGRFGNAGNLLYQRPSRVCQAVCEDRDATAELCNCSLVLQNAAKPECHAFVSCQRPSEGETLSDASRASDANVHN